MTVWCAQRPFAARVEQIDEHGSWLYKAIGNTAGMQGRVLTCGQV